MTVSGSRARLPACRPGAIFERFLRWTIHETGVERQKSAAKKWRKQIISRSLTLHLSQPENREKWRKKEKKLFVNGAELKKKFLIAVISVVYEDFLRVITSCL